MHLPPYPCQNIELFPGPWMEREGTGVVYVFMLNTFRTHTPMDHASPQFQDGAICRVFVGQAAIGNIGTIC